jgi:hypothetical protein
MRTSVQIRAAAICVLLTATVSAATEGESRGIRDGNPPFILHASTGATPQATGRKIRAKRRGQTNGPSSSGGATRGTQSQGAVTPPKGGDKRVRGLLTGVICDARGVTLDLTVGGRKLKLRASDLNSVKTSGGELTCGPRNPPRYVVVIYRPAKDPRAGVDGFFLSIEFQQTG